MDYETLTFEIKHGVAHLTLNRPKNANALNLKMAEELRAVSIRCAEDRAIRSVLLTGNGKAFSGGGDLESFAQAGDQLPVLLKEITTHLHAAISTFSRMSAPLVIAVNGVAAGAGMPLAFSGDFVLAAQSAKFTSAYTKIGLSPDGSSTFILPRLIGLRKTKELLLLNRLLTAQEALDWGLVNQVWPDAELLPKAEEMAKELAHGPTRSFGAVKVLLIDSLSENLETQMAKEARLIGAMGHTKDAKEGIHAFLEKRPAKFTGI